MVEYIIKDNTDLVVAVAETLDLQIEAVGHAQNAKSKYDWTFEAREAAVRSIAKVLDVDVFAVIQEDDDGWCPPAPAGDQLEGVTPDANGKYDMAEMLKALNHNAAWMNKHREPAAPVDNSDEISPEEMASFVAQARGILESSDFLKELTAGEQQQLDHDDFVEETRGNVISMGAWRTQKEDV